jgi:hypothetical protein
MKGRNNGRVSLGSKHNTNNKGYILDGIGARYNGDDYQNKTICTCNVTNAESTAVDLAAVDRRPHCHARRFVEQTINSPDDNLRVNGPIHI